MSKFSISLNYKKVQCNSNGLFYLVFVQISYCKCILVYHAVSLEMSEFSRTFIWEAYEEFPKLVTCEVYWSLNSTLKDRGRFSNRIMFSLSLTVKGCCPVLNLRCPGWKFSTFSKFYLKLYKVIYYKRSNPTYIATFSLFINLCALGMEVHRKNWLNSTHYLIVIKNRFAQENKLNL